MSIALKKKNKKKSKHCKVQFSMIFRTFHDTSKGKSHRFIVQLLMKSVTKHQIKKKIFNIKITCVINNETFTIKKNYKIISININSIVWWWRTTPS